ncbi:hypothetical protein CO726_04915 [Bacillus fungorum]|uniref:Uncharacterized protein n=1 Tax=Bacillus fungorum TaxID=2039284 RepID=A0A2G6QH00_9BACI|nr:hypothetical protein CO726_04915 [Bacillus fungorum]
MYPIGHVAFASVFFLAVIVVLVREFILMVLCGVWLLSRDLYFSVVSITILWDLYIVFPIIYFTSIVWMKKRNA